MRKNKRIREIRGLDYENVDFVQIVTETRTYIKGMNERIAHIAIESISGRNVKIMGKNIKIARKLDTGKSAAV